MSGDEICPRCNRPVAFGESDDGTVETCNSIRSPECWKVIGKARNGGPLLVDLNAANQSPKKEGEGE